MNLYLCTFPALPLFMRFIPEQLVPVCDWQRGSTTGMLWLQEQHVEVSCPWEFLDPSSGVRGEVGEELQKRPRKTVGAAFLEKKVNVILLRDV